MQSLIQKNIHFVCEQNGKVEREFKKKLYLIFLNSNKFIRAYLAQVKYGDKKYFDVALCLKIKGDENEKFLFEIATIF
jgi:hypothetical protein